MTDAVNEALHNLRYAVYALEYILFPQSSHASNPVPAGDVPHVSRLTKILWGGGMEKINNAYRKLRHLEALATNYLTHWYSNR